MSIAVDIAPEGTLTEGLASFIRSKPITAADRDQAALLVLDALANTLAGRNSDPGRILLDWAAAEPGTANRLDLNREAFLLGALTHILETDDLHRASVVHPGCVVVPPAYALARRLGASADDFLDAVIWGFEACCRVGMGVGPAHYRIWHNTATCGAFGSAAAAGRLWTLSDTELVNAFGNAGSQAAGLWQFLETGAMTKHLHAGHAAEAGLKAADLARFGFTGPPEILEGEKGFFRAACPDAAPEKVLAEQDGPWQVHLTSIKPWPSCRHTHPAIDAAQGIVARHGRPFAPEEISDVAVEVYQAALDVCDNPAPTTDYEGKFSLQHCTAAALTRDEVGFDAFDAEGRRAAASLWRKVKPVAAEPYRSRYPQAWGSKVTVTLATGAQLVEARDHAKGDPEARLDRAAMETKAAMLLSHGGIEAPDTLIASLIDLANGGALPDLPLP